MLRNKMTLAGIPAIFSLVCLCALAVPNGAQAAIIYGDFSDVPPGGVMYLDVTESSFSVPVPPNALYGAPTATGNNLDFDPSAFGVSSSGGNSGVVDGQVSFTIMALPGAGLTSFVIAERGDYSFTGVTPTPGTFVSASAGATVTVLEVDGVALANPILLFASDTFVTDYPTTGGAPSTGLKSWSLNTTVDLGPSLPVGFVSGASKIEVSINNQLNTATTLGNLAAIAKKDFTIIPVGDLIPNNVVPEPATLSLAALACLGLVAVRRGKK
ncbi:hypothetical protein Pla175_42660 [Pirellulimonas nuda]|uniref:PEP-CTERM protein-sorting domain-containing protein n=1 Tax=Pirellulimonas nuda TaxID=2528009 RepID=A0A518DHA1_9BACT|nr:hypothetical protein [Pirellulimonas nuda]QDU90853.1 hypothetical protein Pla175_42660 [Pirellulimonas nuda]